MSDDDIGLLLRAAADAVPDSPDRLEGIRSRRRRRRARGGIALAVVALLVGGAVGTDVARPHAAGVPTGTLSPEELVHAEGFVVAVPGKPVQFCGGEPVIVGKPTFIPDQAPVFPLARACNGSIIARGVDLDTLSFRRASDGVVNGEADLTGEYVGGTLTVTQQRPITLPVKSTVIPTNHVDCPAPPGGWAPEGAVINTGAGVLEQTLHRADVPTVTVARPTPGTGIVVIVTWGDPETIRRAIPASYSSNGYCVEQSYFSEADVVAALHDPDLSASGATGVYELAQVPDGSPGTTLSAMLDLKPVVEVECLILTPALSAAAARYPAGLVQLEPWLTPVS